MQAMHHMRLAAAFAAAGLVTLSGCGAAVTEGAGPSVSCSGAAQIQVYDGLMRASCGCAESSTQAVATNLTCTVPAGTLVQFLYIGNSQRHQILSVGAPSFASSPPVDPETLVRAHAAVVSASGTYRFSDALHPALNGQIIVP
jgi:hypothetical protein